MNRIILTLTFIVLNINVIYSQSEIRGIIKDAQDNSIEGVAVVMQTLDSTYIDAGITDSLGIFSIKKSIDNYRLIFQHLLYETKQIETDKNDLGTIVLQEQDYALGEIVVKGERPRVKIENGALTYDISRLAENKVISNAYESILHLPGVNEQDGKLSLIGANELTIILNGKPTTMDSEQLSNILKSTPISKVLKAEVVYNAPARYRVKGAVINIVLNEQTTEINNLQGEIITGYQQRQYGNGNGGINLSFSTKKLFLDFLYSLNYTKTRSGLTLNSQHLFENEIYDIEQVNLGFSKSLKNNIRLGINYSLSPKNKISFTYTGSIVPDKKSNQQSLGSFSDSNTYNDGEENMNNFALDYQSGLGLTAGIDYTNYNSPTTQEFSNKDNDGNILKFISKSNQKINRWKTYISLTHNLRNNFSINYGSEITYVKDKSFQTYNSQEGENMSHSNSLSDIEEYTYNIYAGVEKKTGNYSFSFSLAGEYYKIEDQGNWAIYPTVQLNHMSTRGNILQLSFSANKSYPNYWLSLNNISYLNGYTEVHGNPYLKPAEKYSTRLNYILKNKYIISLYHNYINDYFTQLPHQSIEKLVLIYQILNLDSKQEMGLSFVLPFKFFDFWDINMTIDGNYNKEKCSDFHGLSFNRDKWRIFSRLDNTFNISSTPNIKLEIAGTYMSPLLQGIYDMSEMWQIDVGLKWTFANKNAELKIKGTDMFNKFIPDMKVRYDTQKLNVFPKRDNRSFMLSFTYKFGNYKKKASKSIDTSRFGH